MLVAAQPGTAKKAGFSRIPDHRHCSICGRPMPPDADFCSRDCREKYHERLRREKRSRRVILIIYALLLASLFLLFFRPPPS